MQTRSIHESSCQVILVTKTKIGKFINLLSFLPYIMSRLTLMQQLLTVTSFIIDLMLSIVQYVVHENI